MVCLVDLPFSGKLKPVCKRLQPLQQPEEIR
jgi:hypothetical protein